MKFENRKIKKVSTMKLEITNKLRKNESFKSSFPE